MPKSQGEASPRLEWSHGQTTVQGSAMVSGENSIAGCELSKMDTGDQTKGKLPRAVQLKG